MPTKEEFSLFITKSGLKKKFIAEKVGIPPWVITDWLSGKTILYPLQRKKLQIFMSEFIKNNNFMVEERINDNEISY